MTRVIRRRKGMTSMVTILSAAILMAGVWMIANARVPPASDKQSVAKGPDKGPDKEATTAVTLDQAQHARLVADTLRLSQLAQELRAEVNKSSKDILSVAVVKKAAEVEELARDLKERMAREPLKAR